MECSREVLGDISQPGAVARYSPSPEEEFGPSESDNIFHSITSSSMQDLWSQFEACRTSAMDNLESYCKRVSLLKARSDPSDIATVTRYGADESIRLLSRLKIDKDDLRRDLLEMKIILDFLSTNEAGTSCLPTWILPAAAISVVMSFLIFPAGAFLPKGAFCLCSGGCMLRCTPAAAEYLVLKCCKRTVQGLLDAIENNGLDDKDPGILDGIEFRMLLRFIRQ